MTRCSLKKIVLVTVTTISVVWLFFLGYGYFFTVRQKSILRYKLEEELKRYMYSVCVCVVKHCGCGDVCDV